MKIFTSLVLGFALAACVSAEPVNTTPDSQASALDIYLVRHAEKMIGSDPALTVAGEARAQDLVSELSGAGIERVHSSDTRRTRDTAAPIAKMLGVEVELYDPRDLPGMAAQLKAAPGTHLVVGHSNTTPLLVALLGGDPGEPIVEATEYDRLYRVRVNEGGDVRTDQTTFGK